MLDFIFFNQQPFDSFKIFIKEKQLIAEYSRDNEGFILSLPEDTDDDIMEEIEELYDTLLDLDRDLFEQAEEVQNEAVAAGVTLNLSSGQQIQAKIPVATLNKVLSVMDTHELADFVNAIVDAVENPSEESLCCRQLNAQ